MINPHTLAITGEAIALVRTTRPRVNEMTAPHGMLLVGNEERTLPPRFDVVRLDVLDRATKYSAIAERVVELLKSIDVFDAQRGLWIEPMPEILVDVTGPARPMLDLLRDRRLYPRGVAFVGGGESSAASLVVSEREPFARLASLLQRGRVGFARGAAEERVRTAILSASAESTNTGPALAIALAVWSAERFCQPVFGDKSELGIGSGTGWG